MRQRIPTGFAWKLAGIFVLGGLQGAMGWYMVQSGLVDDPRVSQFRLTAHLGIALAIFAAMFWVGAVAPVSATARSLANPAPTACAGVGVRARGAGVRDGTLGGFVAGIRAGFAYNTFPLMNGHLVPPEIFMLEPWWKNFFWNMATVQFDHRAIAWLLAFLVPVLWWKLRTREGLPARARVGGHRAARARRRADRARHRHAAPRRPGAPRRGASGGAVLVFAAALNVAHALR